MLRKSLSTFCSATFSFPDLMLSLNQPSEKLVVSFTSVTVKVQSFLIACADPCHSVLHLFSCLARPTDLSGATCGNDHWRWHTSSSLSLLSLTFLSSPVPLPTPPAGALATTTRFNQWTNCDMWQQAVRSYKFVTFAGWTTGMFLFRQRWCTLRWNSSSVETMELVMT